MHKRHRKLFSALLKLFFSFELKCAECYFPIGMPNIASSLIDKWSNKAEGGTYGTARNGAECNRRGRRRDHVLGDHVSRYGFSLFDGWRDPHDRRSVRVCGVGCRLCRGEKAHGPRLTHARSTGGRLRWRHSVSARRVEVDLVDLVL